MENYSFICLYFMPRKWHGYYYFRFNKNWRLFWYRSTTQIYLFSVQYLKYYNGIYITIITKWFLLMQLPPFSIYVQFVMNLCPSGKSLYCWLFILVKHTLFWLGFLSPCTVYSIWAATTKNPLAAIYTSSRAINTSLVASFLLRP